MHLFGFLSLLVMLAIITVLLFNHVKCQLEIQGKATKSFNLIDEREVSEHQRGYPVTICQLLMHVVTAVICSHIYCSCFSNCFHKLYHWSFIFLNKLYIFFNIIYKTVYLGEMASCTY